MAKPLSRRRRQEQFEAVHGKRAHNVAPHQLLRTVHEFAVGEIARLAMPTAPLSVAYAQ